MRMGLLPGAVLLAGAIGFLGGATCLGGTREGDLSPPPVPADLRPVLGADDVIEIRVFNEPELSGEFRVGSDGDVRLPLADAVKVAGFSPDQAAEKIVAAYNAKVLRDAQVTVFVKQFNSRKLFVLGQVRKPGPYPFDARMTVIGAIAGAGGTTSTADANRTSLTRESDEGKKRYNILVDDIHRGISPDVPLMPGDIIFVPESGL